MRGRVRILLALAVVSAITWGVLTVQLFQPLDVQIAGLRDWRPAATCEVYDRRGRRIDRFYVERREWVPIDELPPVAWQAMLAAEDRRFLEHPGVDLLGIIRAIYVNALAGEIREGGSTLTQQLAKNLVVGDERSYTRKVREAVVAWRMEKTLSKWEILEIYLNYIYLGSGNYGLEAAAQDYFGISARDLSAGQSALIAGLIPAPTLYSPRRAPEEARVRRRIVLNAMMQEGYISAETVYDYSREPISPPDRSGIRSSAAAYLTEVRREIRRLLGREQAFAIGLQVYTPLDTELQAVAEAAISDAVAGVMARQGLANPSRLLSPAQLTAFISADATTPDPSEGLCFEAAVLRDRQLGAGTWRGSLSREAWQQRIRGGAPGIKSRSLAAAVQTGAIIEVCPGPDGTLAPSPRPWLDGAAAIIENKTGAVLAMSGGIEATLEGFNKATQARRQPGSSFKPYVYTAALLDGMTQLDRVVDGPLSLPGGNGKTWSPQNYSGGYRGALPMRDALAASLNTVAVRLVLDAGPEAVADVAHRLGVTAPLRDDLTIALGSSEVSVLDQATGYSSLARMGVYIEPSYISRLENADGEVLARSGELIAGAAEPTRLPGPPGERVLPAPIAYEMIDMLRAVVQRGTARRARVAGLDRAGKTGTTNDFVDAWFVGTTPRHTIAVWVGANDRSGLGQSETGGRAALPAWLAIAEALEPAPGEHFPIPDGVAFIEDGREWVGIPREQVPPSRLTLPTVDADTPLPDFPTTSPRH
ncbi:MAG: penicillin-binding protein 1A [Myxococcota bacterium]|jgi:penicillin-binding protein 1A